MAKLIRIILIIAISFAASSATTILLMLHYSKPLEVLTTKSHTVACQQGYFEKESIEPVEWITEDITQSQAHNIANTESARALPGDSRYFDYALLSKDIAVFSEKISRFNEVLSREIQKLKKVTSEGEKISP